MASFYDVLPIKTIGATLHLLELPKPFNLLVLVCLNHFTWVHFIIYYELRFIVYYVIHRSEYVRDDY